MKWLANLAMILILVACAAPQTQSPAERAITYWKGHSIDEVIAAWGPPTTETLENDHHFYVWEASHYDQRYYPANLYSQDRVSVVRGREELACKGVFAVDEKGIVTKADWQGYECHFLP